MLHLEAVIAMVEDAKDVDFWAMFFDSHVEHLHQRFNNGGLADVYQLGDQKVRDELEAIYAAYLCHDTFAKNVCNIKHLINKWPRLFWVTFVRVTVKEGKGELIVAFNRYLLNDTEGLAEVYKRLDNDDRRVLDGVICKR